jgi:hypothetical protein
MKPFDAAPLIQRGRFYQLLWTQGQMPRSTILGNTFLTAERRDNLAKDLADLEKILIELDLDATLATAQRLRKSAHDPAFTDRELSAISDDLIQRLVDEIRNRFFLSLTLQETEHFQNPRKDWQSIIERFPAALDDIEEARKCYALSRYAASIFHSVEVVEVGLLELGMFIGVNDPHSGWSAVANELKKIVGKQFADRTDFERLNYQFLEQTQGTVEALKNAWRNKINHAQGRLYLLSKEFTPEIAEEILIATRAFMRRLAEGLPAKS